LKACCDDVLIQHITPRVPSTLTQELYVFGAAGLQQQFIVRPCAASTDMAGIGQLVRSLHLGDVLLADVQQYINARRDQVKDDPTHDRKTAAIEIVDFALLRELLEPYTRAGNG